MLEHLNFLYDHEVVKVRRHAEHEAVLHVERDFACIAVFSDELVDGVGLRDPANEARIGRQRDDGVSGNAEVALRGLAVISQHGVDQTEQLHHALVLSQVLMTLQTRCKTANETNSRPEADNGSVI